MDNGILKIYSLENISEPGYMPVEKLVKVCDAYYAEQTVGVTRLYAALGANQKIDMLVRCYNTVLPENAEYVILEDGKQYRITVKQNRNCDVDLTLERLGENYDVADKT